MAQARAHARRRLADTPWSLNSQVPGHWLRGPQADLDTQVLGLLELAMRAGCRYGQLTGCCVWPGVSLICKAMSV